MLLIATKNHRYQGRPIRTGQQYNVRDMDVPVICAAGLAKKPVPTRQIEDVDTESSLDDNAYELESVLISDEVKEKSKRQRRYRRKDMVPEK